LRRSNLPPRNTKSNAIPTTGKGKSTALAILLAAEQLLIDEGYHNFSLRKVASAAGLTLGNLQYYFPSKDSLIKAMLDNYIERYLALFERIRSDAGADPREQFTALIGGIVRDLNNKSTTVFFPEVWSLSNHDDHATEFMDAMYGRYRDVLIDVMTMINPALSPVQLRRLAIFISASIEGHTIFIGHEKPWVHETEAIAYLGTQSFLWLVESGDIPD
jgi:AcrR family transcriptional regulator